VGPVGFLLNQQAFQSGRLVSPALAVITTTTALVSIGIGYLWLDESFASGPTEVFTEVASLAVMTAGIVLLAHRAPAVARRRAAMAGAAANPGRETHRRGEQQDTGRGDDVEQIMIRGREHADRRDSRVEPGYRS
jgi:hypothetical protein